MNWIILLARLLLGAVFLVAALGKLADPQGSRQAVASLPVNFLSRKRGRLLEERAAKGVER